jgi:hypothetical protein
MYHGQQKDENPLFYISLGVNGIRFHNFMLEFGVLEKVMSLNIMEQLGLKKPTHIEMCATLIQTR